MLEKIKQSNLFQAFVFWRGMIEYPYDYRINRCFWHFLNKSHTRMDSD